MAYCLRSVPGRLRPAAREPVRPQMPRVTDRQRGKCPIVRTTPRPRLGPSPPMPPPARRAPPPSAQPHRCARRETAHAAGQQCRGRCPPSEPAAAACEAAAVRSSLARRKHRCVCPERPHHCCEGRWHASGRRTLRAATVCCIRPPRASFSACWACGPPPQHWPSALTLPRCGG
jgi:hypothetical protein